MIDEQSVGIKDDDSNVLASVTTRGAKGAIATELLDASGNQITSFGAGEQYLDNEPIGAKKGTIALGTDGVNYQMIAVNNEGKLKTFTENTAILVCSTNVPLPIGGSYSNLCDLSDKLINPFEKSKITGIVFANVSGTLYINQWVAGASYTIKTITVEIATPKTFCIENVSNKISITYTNGGIAQTNFRLEIWAQPSGVGFNVEDGKGLVDVSNNATRDMGKIDIAGFDVPLPAGTNNIGDVDIVTMPAVVVTSLPALPAGTNTIGAVKDAGITWTPVQKNANYATAQTDIAIWTPASGKSIILIGILLSTDTAMNIFFKVATTTIIPKIYLASNGGANVSSGQPIWKGGVNEILTFTSSVAGNHSVMVWGYEE